MIRIFFALLFLFTFLIISIIIQLIEELIGLFSKKAKALSSLAIVKWAFRVIIFISGTKLTVIGEENVPKEESVLYVLNHRGYFDILLTYTRVPRPTGYVAKKEMLKYLTLTKWMKNLYCEFMDRSDLRKGMESINNCAEKIKKGISIAIFPEGTRNKSDAPLLDFHKGSFKIAEKTGCKVVPVVLNNTSAVFEDQFPLIRKQHVVLEYLPAIDVAAMDREEKKQLCDMVKTQMEETYLRNQKLI
ncbi:MAG: 1-acyl-sn-glycerol-3-phosphate acyltransferase [Lachnospiraceae bacterium]|nr:1-acyl-sn-glycerol-3-phosphate acyltransferase [Lachnospiraceae bacterium]